MTRPTESKSDATENDRTMADVSHTNPYTGRTAGHLFSRGPIVAADGGEPERTPARRSADADRTDDESNRTMASVDHTPPHDADDANRVFERGKRNDRVEDAE
ncbi:hypothetical protein [Natrarchaeobius oligotrophus]|uniref:Uncharacterized protein n=1 Tax=Natrarchaeobius chitinivorans TaxID=1679083 RepID=A0A3N6MC07_NATCH|nr:hypothetical protein [Natrarchaeobius chitinivorans]RQH01339.1 hypothetical protein EA472_07795 [Natrarchaeobius chitinivorans]